MEYMGIDCHKQYLVTALMDEEGRLIRQDRVPTSRRAIEAYFAHLPRGSGPLNAVMEASRNWTCLYDDIAPLVDSLVLAHPLKTRVIAEAKIKTDKIDARHLAHLLRTNLIPLAYIPGRETREMKNLVRFRIALVRLSTIVKNRVHFILARNHFNEVEISDVFGKKGRELLGTMSFAGRDRMMIDSYLEILDDVQKRIAATERIIAEIVKNDSVIQLLKSVPGIGDVLAPLLRFEIDDIARFATPRKLWSYAGLVPSTYSSGGKTRHGRLTKQGNVWIRWAMVEAVHAAVKKDVSLRRYYGRIAAKAGKNAATTATARKLLEIIHRVWRTGRPFYVQYAAVALPSI